MPFVRRVPMLFVARGRNVEIGDAVVRLWILCEQDVVVGEAFTFRAALRLIARHLEFLGHLIGEVEEFGIPESQPKREGRLITFVIAPKKVR